MKKTRPVSFWDALRRELTGGIGSVFGRVWSDEADVAPLA